MKVLDKGFVEVIDTLGDDLTVVVLIYLIMDLFYLNLIFLLKSEEKKN